MAIRHNGGLQLGKQYLNNSIGDIPQASPRTCLNGFFNFFHKSRSFDVATLFADMCFDMILNHFANRYLYFCSSQQYRTADSQCESSTCMAAWLHI